MNAIIAATVRIRAVVPHVEPRAVPDPVLAFDALHSLSIVGASADGHAVVDSLLLLLVLALASFASFSPLAAFAAFALAFFSTFSFLASFHGGECVCSPGGGLPLLVLYPIALSGSSLMRVQVLRVIEAPLIVCKGRRGLYAVGEGPFDVL